MNFTQQEKVAVLLVILSVVIGAGILGMRRGAAPVTLDGREIATAVGASEHPGGAGTGSAAGGSVDQQPAPSRQERRGTTPAAASRVTVHVGGAVLRPGVYSVPKGSRTVDAIKVAGGGVSTADLDTLNLAAVLVDGQKIQVLECGAPPPAGAGADGASGVVVNINTAGESELDALPGVGPALAKRIADYRTSNGPFASVAELDKVSGIGPKMVARIGDAAVAQ